MKTLCTIGADVNAKNAVSKTALWEACANGHLEIATFLVTTCGANLDHMEFELPLQKWNGAEPVRELDYSLYRLNSAQLAIGQYC